MYYARNPILPGFCPDPSICRVEDDYYIVTSSFAYFPGVPIYHSKDLAHWEQIGHVLTRESQLPLNGCGHSEGIFAPVLRYHKGTFYMITTNISGGGNFIVTAKKPEGPWSEPYFLGDAAKGIDPSLYFEEDADGNTHCYYIGTRPNSNGVSYNGDWEIWLEELDLETMKLKGDGKKVWKGAMNGGIWPEGPHLYKKDGLYYIMHAEGGTGPDHCVAIARSENLWGPYAGNPDNPILTHRHLGTGYPVMAVGHGDLVDDGHGNWYMVMLASRKCEGYVNTGRDTFLAKVIWENGWPIVNPGVGKLEDTVEFEGEASYVVPQSRAYHFFREKLPYDFVMLRNPDKGAVSLSEREGYLRLYTLPQTLEQKANPAYVGLRQRDYYYQVSTVMEFEPKGQEEAGLCILCGDGWHLRFVKRLYNNKEELRLIYCKNGVEETLAHEEVQKGRIELKIVNRGQRADFYYQQNDCGFKQLAEKVDVHEMSTECSGGFTGCTIGMYASANGIKNDNFADFAMFSYEGIFS